MASRLPRPRGKDTLFRDIRSFRDDFVYSLAPKEGAFTDNQKAAIIGDIEGYPTYGTRADPKSRLLRGPMLHAREHEIQCSDRLRVVMNSVETTAKTFPADHPIKVKLDALSSLWTTICSLKQIDRYLAAEQPPLLEIPDTNGRNLGYSIANPRNHTAFATEADLQKLTIMLLHAPGLIRLNYDPKNPPTNYHDVGFDAPGVRAIQELYTLGRLLLQEELNRVTPDEKDDFPRALFNTKSNWVRVVKKNIVNALEGVAILACSRPDPTQAELEQCILDMRKERAEAGLRLLTKEEEEEAAEEKLKVARAKSFQENLDANFAEKGVRFLVELEKDIEERLIAENHLDPLIMDLVRREDEFEAALSLEHYEDKLINKQVSLLSEEQITEIRPWEPKMTVPGLNDGLDPDGDGGLKAAEVAVYKILQDMGLVSRHRRDFRLLRDWLRKRPWRQIYQLYDSDNAAEPKWVEEGIDLFDQRVFTQFNDEDPSIPPVPTSLSFVLPRIFGFLPIDTAYLVNQRFYGDCTICTQGLYNPDARPLRGFDNTVVELHCSSHHKFHLKCIFNFWDLRGKYLHDCPQCGEMAKLNYEIQGISPNHGNFVHNNQNYKTAANVAKYLDSDNLRSKTFARKARELYDVPDVPISPRQSGDLMQLGSVFEPTTHAGHDYYEGEILRRAALLAMPVTWQGFTIDAGIQAGKAYSPPSLPTPKILSTAIENIISYDEFAKRQDVSRKKQARQQAERIAKKTGDMYLKREFERGRADVYDVDSERVLPAARLAPSMEAGFLRSARRRREHKLRERIRKEGRGLGGLK